MEKRGWGKNWIKIWEGKKKLHLQRERKNFRKKKGEGSTQTFCKGGNLKKG